MKTYTFTINRGGTGKTTSAGAMAEAAALDGFRVLLIDLDAQCSLSFLAGADLSSYNAFDLLTKRATIRTAIQDRGGLSIIPAGPLLSTITQGDDIRRLKRLLEPIENEFDYCFIDTHPETGELVFEALAASDGAILPLQAEIIALQGFYQVEETIKRVQKVNRRLQIAGLLVCRYDKTANIQTQYLEAIQEAAAERDIPVLGIIRDGKTLQNAQARRRGLLSYRPKSGQATDYLEAWKRLKL